MDLVDLPPVDDIYQYIVDRLTELVPGARIYLFAHDEVDRQFVIRAVAGEGFREGLTELLRRDPVGLVLPVARAFDAPYHQTPHVMRGMQESSSAPSQPRGHSTTSALGDPERGLRGDPLPV